MNLTYSLEQRANKESCPVCGFWHTSNSCPPQVAGMAMMIAKLNDELTALRESLKEAIDEMEDSMQAADYEVASTIDGMLLILESHGLLED